MIWLTIDVEEITDMNFNIKWKKAPAIDYEQRIETFIKLVKNHKATAFVLGSFAEKYPELVKKLSDNGVEIACHGYSHTLLYKQSLEQWRDELVRAKELLEKIIGKSVHGYRSPSWSMPFDKKYYTELAKLGFSYSSSYFPMKNYMYGNSINKKEYFNIHTSSGVIQERPIIKNIIPFSGGFYLRVLPLWLLKILFGHTKNPIIYIHPYELEDKNMLFLQKEYASFNIDYILAFYSTGHTTNKLKSILQHE